MMRRWDTSSSNPEQYKRSPGRKAEPDRILDPEQTVHGVAAFLVLFQPRTVLARSGEESSTRPHPRPAADRAWDCRFSCPLLTWSAVVCLWNGRGPK